MQRGIPVNLNSLRKKMIKNLAGEKNEKDI